jgi:hypothetical protein
MSNSIPATSSPIDSRALLTEFDSSGLSAAAFARSKGLPSWRIYNALQKRSGKVRARRLAARAQSNALLPVHVIEARQSPQPAAIELLLPGGHRVVIGADFDAVTLRRLLGALAQC